MSPEKRFGIEKRWKTTAFKMLSKPKKEIGNGNESNEAIQNIF
jgi:hypothetical protein